MNEGTIEIIGISKFRKLFEKQKEKTAARLKKDIERIISQPPQDFYHQIADLIARNTGFTAKEVYLFFVCYGSWDKTMIACAYAKEHKIQALDLAWIELSKQFNEKEGVVSVEQMLRKYQL